MREPLLKRRGVLLTREDIPIPPTGKGDVTSVFNPGAVQWRGADRLLLRVQSRSRETHIYAATTDTSSTPPDLCVHAAPIEFPDLMKHTEHLRVYHVYDPRLTVVEESVLAVFAVDTEQGCRLLTARTLDFEEWEVLAVDSSGDRRNGVIFPERIGGGFARLERPNVDSRDGSPSYGAQVVLSTSPDLKEWTEVGPVFSGRSHYWDELVGPGTPPILTDKGWLLLYHGVATHFASANVYQTGAILLDREDPTRVVGRTRENILEPRELYETVGQVPNVVFPSGWIPRAPVISTGNAPGTIAENTTIDIFYGAADTCVAWATTTVKQLLDSLEDPTALS